MFDNVSWPSVAIYNITSDGETRIAGGADVEHHYIEDGRPNVWIQKAKLRTALQGYYRDASDRCSES